MKKTAENLKDWFWKIEPRSKFLIEIEIEIIPPSDKSVPHLNSNKVISEQFFSSFSQISISVVQKQTVNWAILSQFWVIYLEISKPVYQKIVNFLDKKDQKFENLPKKNKITFCQKQFF